MNLPNKLTILRMILTFVFIAFLLVPGILAKSLALFIFLVASLTDALDGYLAKKNNQITDFGRIMDPIADKILVLAAFFFLAFVEKGIVPKWMVVIIILREALITGLRVFAITKGRVIPADIGGKNKTAWQLSAITVILLFLIFREGGAGVFHFWTARVEASYRSGIDIIMAIAVTLTVVSGIRYVVKNKEVYSNAKED